jgi:hypothetical protein
MVWSSRSASAERRSRSQAADVEHDRYSSRCGLDVDPLVLHRGHASVDAISTAICRKTINRIGGGKE